MPGGSRLAEPAAGQEDDGGLMGWLGSLMGPKTTV